MKLNLLRLSNEKMLIERGVEKRMMKVFICQNCGWLRVVSRRKDVECFKCGEKQMTLAKIDFEKYTSMSETERKDYADGWLYIHKKAKR